MYKLIYANAFNCKCALATRLHSHFVNTQKKRIEFVPLKRSQSQLWLLFFHSLLLLFATVYFKFAYVFEKLTTLYYHTDIQSHFSIHILVQFDWCLWKHYEWVSEGDQLLEIFHIYISSVRKVKIHTDIHTVIQTSSNIILSREYLKTLISMIFLINPFLYTAFRMNNSKNIEYKRRKNTGNEKSSAKRQAKKNQKKKKKN